MNILSLKRNTTAVTRQRQALKDNLQAIRDIRTRLEAVMVKDRAAAADITAADNLQHRVDTLREALDQAAADAAYSGDEMPDLRIQQRDLADAESALKQASAKARAAVHVRQKYAVDMGALHDAIRVIQPKTTRLLWEALREDELASLGAEFLAAEAAFLDVAKRAFAAALAVDRISMSQAWGEFVGSGNVHDLHLARPDHPAFIRAELTPEQAQAERQAYAKGIEAAADALMDQLLNK